MTRIVCLTTGGTIAALRDDAGALVTAQAGAAVAGHLHDVEVVEVARCSSTVLGLAEVFGWARDLAARLAAPDVGGAVVTVGTETLEEVAYLLDLAVRSEQPVVVTGAMRPPDAPDADGAANLADALAVARAPAARGACALVVLDGAVHAARDATKRHASARDAFTSPGGPLGRVRGGELELLRPPPPREHLAAARLEERVTLVRAALGAGGEAVDGAVAAGARGLVLETFPAGGVPPAMAAAVERALDAGVAVVAASRAAGGPVTDYAGVGEGRWLAERGVLLAPGLQPAKARIRLALALGLDDPAALARVFL